MGKKETNAKRWRALELDLSGSNTGLVLEWAAPGGDGRGVQSTVGGTY